MGQGDLHHPYFDNDAKTATFSSLLQDAGFNETMDGISFAQDYCPVEVQVYPSAVYLNEHMTNAAIVVTAVIVIIFSFTFLVFLVYGGFVEGKVEKLGKKAAHTSKLINTLFPKEVQERMFKAGGAEEQAALLHQGDASNDPLSKIKTFLKEAEAEKNDIPIADLWPKMMLKCPSHFG